MSGAKLPLPNTPPRRGAQLKHRDNFTFYFLINIYQNVGVWYFTDTKQTANKTSRTAVGLLRLTDAISLTKIGIKGGISLFVSIML
jgi:hypothetical protein